jgi:predicted nucleotidyltransferase
MNIMNDPTLEQIIERLTAEFHPSRMFLFGSRANGTFQSDSDYDLVLVVSSSDRSRLDRMEQARLALKGVGVSADVFVYTEQEFNKWKDEFSSIPETALNTGRELRVG